MKKIISILLFVIGVSLLLSCKSKETVYYKVEFNTNGGSNVSVRTVEEATKVARPSSNPTKEGYIFVNWYKDSNLTVIFDFDNELIKSNIVIYAKWEVEEEDIVPIVNYYTVSFNTHGGSQVSTVKVEEGQLVTRPENPSHLDYQFEDWYLPGEDTYYGTIFDFSTPINGNYVIHAKWAGTEVEFDKDLAYHNPDFSYYAETQMNYDRTVYVFNSLSKETLNDDLGFTAQAIEGLFARDEVTFFYDGRIVTNLINSDRYHLEQTAERFNLTLVDITLEDGIKMYMDAWSDKVSGALWGSQIPLSRYNNIPGRNAYTETTGEGYSTPGYIVYRKGTISVNIAATLSGITGFLPIERENVEFAKSLGLVEKMNIDSILFDYAWVFERTLSELNPNGLVHQNFAKSAGETNPFLKDYGIAFKYIYVYYDSNTSAPQSFRSTLHSFLNPNIPIFGYAYNEVQDVAFFSKYGQFLIPTDYSYNLSYLAANLFKTDGLGNGDAVNLVQPGIEYETNIADAGKHYVSFVVSDGDNIQMWQNTSLFATNFMNAVGRDSDTFPVTWSISPSMVDIVPSIIYSAYHERGSIYDSFAAPVSGQGYIDVDPFMNAGNNKEYLMSFLNNLDLYLRKAGLSTVTLIGANSGTTAIDLYAQVPAVKGGIVLRGSKYFGSLPGSVHWSNGKPFIGPRDSLWETTPEYIAARINMYETDPTTVNGYSIINVHPWSHSYNDIRTIVNALSSHVEVVSVDRLIELMTNNVVDKTEGDNIWQTVSQNGVSITKSYLEQHPELIPVNPLNNDFLLWAEDWSASKGTISFSSSDQANSNVGSYLTSIAIPSGAIASKAQFVLPSQDNLWIRFVARGNATSSSTTTNMSLRVTINGVTKTIIDSATLKGVSGTGSATNVAGDGWQFFAFPISQYFDEYKGLSCKIEVEANGGNGIKLDKFVVEPHSITPNGEYNPYNNQFLNGNTEDWFLGYQFITSQYTYFGALDKDTGRPIGDGAIQMDFSDGGGNEKRNGNSNLFIAKTYTLPESTNITVKFAVNSSQANSGGMYKVSMYVDGRYIVLQEWVRGNNSNSVTVNLNQSYSDINFSGKVVTVVIETRDSAKNDGIGELLFFRYFQTIDNQ